MPPELWEIWLDTQLSPIIAKWMAEHTGYTVKSSYILQLNNLSDTVIYTSQKQKAM
jgi:LysM repeat protein